MDTEGFEPSTSRMRSVRATPVPSAPFSDFAMGFSLNVQGTANRRIWSINLILSIIGAEYSLR